MLPVLIVDEGAEGWFARNAVTHSPPAPLKKSGEESKKKEQIRKRGNMDGDVLCSWYSETYNGRKANGGGGGGGRDSDANMTGFLWWKEASACLSFSLSLDGNTWTDKHLPAFPLPHKYDVIIDTTGTENERW